ncbi:MAG TPA: WD40 repeat domain-containing serine/threonine-protein kinase [Ktedonobacteraceae bacterium]|jgi:WD40 repeat protein|nr:WD40 repeat domain-containing serine/threonine-protein kinase [Ktedonobacteraceae bacterium]
MTLTSHEFCDTCGAANRPQAQFCRACGQPLRAPAVTITVSNTLTGLLSPQHMLKQRYVILGPAGRGGFGAVYKAMDTQFGDRQVAIKEMSQSNLTPLELGSANHAFHHEAILLGNLTHPNLPRIYEQFVDAGRSYLVMDFIDGETLAEHLERLNGQKLSLQRVLDISLQLCSVLEYLHGRQPPIIFRDLKPANVMIDASNHVYLIDFGIARQFKPGQAKDTTALGSSGYAAPEQYGRSQTTVRADLYALGATLHQLLTGEDPAASPFHFSPLSFADQPALQGLETLVMSMLHVEVERRPVSATFVKQELQRFSTQYLLGQTQAPSPKIPVAYQAPQMDKPLRTPRPPKPPIQSQIRPMSNMLFVCYGHTSRITSLGWSPDGKLLASASYDKTIHLYDAANGKEQKVLTGHRDRVNNLSWSPDNKFLASASADGLVTIWDVARGESTFFYTHHAGHVNAVSWSPDGSRLASAGDDKTVQVWSPTDNTMLLCYTEHQGKILTLAWSPDGRRIASGGEDCRLHIWEPEKNQQRRSFLSRFFSQRGQEILRGHQQRINSLSWSGDGKHLATAGSDHDVYIWDAQTGHKVSHITGNGMKNVVVWSPDHKHVAVGGNDKTVIIYNTLTRKEFAYRGHAGFVFAATWSPDGSRIASAGVDRTVQVWQAV